MKRPELEDAVIIRETVAEHHESAAPALVVTPHPVTLAQQRVYGVASVVPGETLASLLARHGVRVGEGWVATIGGVPVADQNWHRVKPRPGHLIEARPVVKDNQYLRIIAIAVLSYYTMGAGATGAGGWAAGMSSGAAYGYGMAALIAGTLVINALLPIKSQGIAGIGSSASDSTYSISGANNSSRPFEPMALVLGTPFCVPDIAAQPYTYFQGDDQYLWQVFHCGLNCAEVEDIKIGDTDITDYSDVTISRQGFESDNTGLALPSNVTLVDGALLEAPAGTVPGSWVKRTSAAKAGMLAIDLEGSIYNIDSTTGDYQSLKVEVESQYRLVDDSQGDEDNWVTFIVSPPVEVIVADHEEYVDGGEGGYSGYVTVPGYTYTYTPTYIELVNASTKATRVTLTKTVSSGQYEVRLRKRTQDISSSTGSNTVTWDTLRTYQTDTTDYDSQSLFGVQIKASGQLSGALDEVNCRAIAKSMPYWDGTEWTTATSREDGLCNPGAQILLLCRGIYATSGKLLAGLGLDDDLIDIDSLKDFMVHCADKGLYFSLFQQSSISTIDLMEQIAYSGIGAISWHTGKIGVIWFEQDEPLRGVINMAAMTASSFSVAYSTQETADEIEVKYFDRDNNDWATLRVTAPGVDVPDNVGSLSLTGIDNEEQAAMLGRFSMAQNLYQRKIISAGVDLEHLTFRRGTVMSLSHDMTQWGYGGRLRAARFVSGATVELTLDELVPATGPDGQTSRYIGLRLAGERQYRIFAVQAFTDETRTLTLATDWPTGVALPGNNASNPAEDALWVYDFKATPGQMVRVASIEPSSNLKGATVTFVPESDEFWEYVWTGSYTPAPSSSLLPGPPVVSGVLISERLLRSGDIYSVEITASFSISGSYARAELRGGLLGAASDDDEEEAATIGQTLVTTKLADTDNLVVSFVSSGLSDRWLFKLQPFSLGGLSGAPAYVIYQVKGKSIPPSDVTNFRINDDVLSWTEVADVDVAGYLIKFQQGSNKWWPTAVALHDGLVTDSPWTLLNMPSDTVTLMIKAVDTSGNESENSAVIVVNLGDHEIRNILFSTDEHPDFTGTKTACSIDDGVLLADPLDNFFYPADSAAFMPAEESAFDGGSYATMSYEWNFNAIAAGVVTLGYQLGGSGFQIEYRIGDQSLAFDPAAALAFEPADEPFFGSLSDWSAWPGSLNITAEQVIYFRITLDGGVERGAIYELSTILDVPDLIERFNDIDIAAGGTRIPITKTYRAISNVLLTLQADGGTGVGVLLIDKDIENGPMVQVVDGSSVSVAGVVDVVIQGY